MEIDFLLFFTNYIFGPCVQLCHDCCFPHSHSQTGVLAGGRWRHRCRRRRSNGDICTHSSQSHTGDPKHTCGVRRVDTKGTQTDVFSVSHCVSSRCHGTQHNNMDTQNSNLWPCADNVDAGVCAKRLLVLA